MSVFNFPGYLAHSRKSLGGELIGFNKKTGRAVYAAAGVQGLGSYADLSTDFYKTFRPDNWQHAGSSGWSSANMPGWGNNPNLQMFARRGVDGADDLPATALALIVYGLVAWGAYSAYKAVRR